ncbi:MAG: ABC transporter permease [Acidobacteriota bacterium]|nr:ABC transporter permease [Acidobacteriota bacterium]
MRELWRRLWDLVHRRRLDAELAEELAFHREMKEGELEKGGASPADARLDARRALGSTALAHDHAYDVWVPHPLQGVGQDIRFSFRMLRKDRWFTLAVVLTLALGIGGSGTVFAIVEGMSLRGLPVPQPFQIVSIGVRDSRGLNLALSAPQFKDWSRAARSFSGIGGYVQAGMIVADRGEAAERAAGAYVSADTFSLLRIRPILGRDFASDDDRKGAAPTVILGYPLWQSRYGGDPHIIGRSIRINGMSSTVIGVMPNGFGFPLIEKLWQPLAMAPTLQPRERDARVVHAFGRLRDGVSRAQGQAELDTIANVLAREYPKSDAGLHALVKPFIGGLTGFGNPWTLALAAVAVLLLIACANVAGLLLTRALRRSRDLAVRVSLGASAWRIIRQLLVESLLIGTVAAGIGLELTHLGLHLWITSLPQSNWPFWYRWSIDGQVVVFLTAVSLVLALVCGLTPALRVRRAGADELTREGPRSGTIDRHANRLTSVFLVGELALTLVLLAGAGLLVRSTAHLLQAQAIVDASHVLLGDVHLPAAGYGTPAQQVACFRDLQARLDAQPAIDSFSIANAMPFYSAPVRLVTIRGQAPPRNGLLPHASYVTTGGHYFDTLGVHLLLGRVFNDVDGTPGHEAAIVNRRFASMYFGEADPIGRQIRVTDPEAARHHVAWMTVVGVAPDIQQHYFEDLEPAVYVPFVQDPAPVAVLLARGRGDPETLIPLVRDVVHTMDPTLVVFNQLSLAKLRDEGNFANQVFLTIFGAFAGFALLLSAIGLYAATAYAVTQRTHEIGVRMTLGARRHQVAGLFLSRVLRLVVGGGAIGLLCAIAVTRLMRDFLVQTSPSDPVTLVTMAGLLAAVAVAATLIAARRATRLDPVAALRHD